MSEICVSRKTGRKDQAHHLIGWGIREGHVHDKHERRGIGRLLDIDLEVFEQAPRKLEVGQGGNDLSKELDQREREL
jgi:hypothetical protein